VKVQLQAKHDGIAIGLQSNEDEHNECVGLCGHVSFQFLAI
jgi:hypothetical protein